MAIIRITAFSASFIVCLRFDFVTCESVSSLAHQQALLAFVLERETRDRGARQLASSLLLDTSWQLRLIFPSTAHSHEHCTLATNRA